MLRNVNLITDPPPIRATAGRLIDVVVGSRLRKIRLEQGWTLPEVGSEIKVSVEELAEYERGDLRPSATTLFALIGFYHVTLAALYAPAPQ